MRVGIDLGTTYSLISQLGYDSRPLLMPDHSVKDIFATPSVAYIQDGTALVGHLVENLLEQRPDLPVIRYFKRQFGVNKPIFFDKLQQGWYPETIGALILKKLKFDAENFSGNDISSGVITVPAHFNDLQRKAVMNAAVLADIPLLGLVEEPVAAAMHYGVQNRSYENVILVYDLGGGTFDATLLSLDPKGVYVLAKDGITELGGKEFDEKIAEYILQQYEKSYGRMPDLNAFLLLQLRRVAEEVKIELSLPHAQIIRKTILLGNQALEMVFNRSMFEQRIFEAIESTLEVTLRCIEGAGVGVKDVNTVLLVGGSSMIPYIRKRLQEIFKYSNQEIKYHEPMKAVAYGASVYAAQLGGDAEKFDLPPEFTGITGFNIGIKTIDPDTGKMQIDTLIRKNLPLPIKASRTYYTSSSAQRRIVLDLVQFRNEGDEFINVGSMVIGPIPNPRANYAVEVTVENTEDGTIAVSAFDPNTGIELEQSFGISDGADNYLFAQKKILDKTIINNF